MSVYTTVCVADGREAHRVVGFSLKTRLQGRPHFAKCAHEPAIQFITPVQNGLPFQFHVLTRACLGKRSFFPARMFAAKTTRFAPSVVA